MSEDFEVDVDFSIHDCVDDVDPDATSPNDAGPTEADCLDMAAPSNADRLVDQAYREWRVEQRYQYAVERRREETARSSWYGRARCRGHARRPRRHHRASAARAPTASDSDGDDGPAPSPLESLPTGATATLVPPNEQPGTPARLIEALAMAVVRPGGNALLLTPDNSKDRWVSIREATDSGRAFAVDVDRDVLAIDADSPELGRTTEDLAAKFEAKHLRPVLVASGRPGHRHLFCRITDAEVLNRHRAAAKALGLDVRRTIRPPLAPHRSGLEVELLEPRDPTDALEALRRHQPELPDADTPVKRRRPLSPGMSILLAHGDTDGRYSSRSELIQALATAMVNAGWTEAEFSEAVLEPSNLAGVKTRAMKPKEREQYISRSWNRAERFVTANPAVRDRAGARAAISRVATIADAVAWPGRGGATERTILEAHIQIAFESSKLTYHADVRTLAEKAGVVASTASRANWRLVEAGWLGQDQPSRKGEANTWTLRAPVGTLRNTPISFPGEEGGPLGNTQDPRGGVRTNGAESPSSPPDAHLDHDAFRWGGLGKSTHRVFAALDATRPSQVEDLVVNLRMSPEMVPRHLRRLAKCELALSTSDGWRRGVRPLDEVAAELGMLGRGWQQRERHKDDRDNYSQAVETFRGERRHESTNRGLVVRRRR